MNKAVPIGGGIIVVIAIIAIIGMGTDSQTTESIPEINLSDSIEVKETSGKSFDVNIEEGLKMGDTP